MDCPWNKWNKPPSNKGLPPFMESSISTHLQSMNASFWFDKRKSVHWTEGELAKGCRLVLKIATTWPKNGQKIIFFLKNLCISANFCNFQLYETGLSEQMMRTAHLCSPKVLLKNIVGHRIYVKMSNPKRKMEFVLCNAKNINKSQSILTSNLKLSSNKPW